MLPDYPRIKRTAEKALMKRVNRAVVRAPFDDVRHMTCHEGHGFRIERHDGSVTEQEFHEVTGSMELSLRDFDGVTMDDVINLVDKTASEMGHQMSKRFYQELDRAVEEVGNVLDARGRPFTADMYLDMIEKMEMSFDRDGHPNFPTMVAAPAIAQKADAELGRLDTDPEIRARLEEILLRKKAEWREREGSRKLVG